MLKKFSVGGVVQSDYSVSSLSSRELKIKIENREREIELDNFNKRFMILKCMLNLPYIEEIDCL